MCPMGFALNQISTAFDKELTAAKFCLPNFEVTSAHIEDRIKRATVNATKARADLEEHVAGCSKCARWLM